MNLMQRLEKYLRILSRPWTLAVLAVFPAALMALVPLPGELGALLFCPAFLLLARLLFRCVHRAGRREPLTSRAPELSDADEQSVSVDPELLNTPCRVLCAAQPFQLAPSISLRLGSGALLMGTAIAYCADETPIPAEKAALLRAAADMNIQQQVLRRQSPVLERLEKNGMQGVLVQDGRKQRTYYWGPLENVAKACGTIWDVRIRPLTRTDRTNLEALAENMAHGRHHVYAFATSDSQDGQVFLGLVALGQSLRPEAAASLTALAEDGLTVVYADSEHPAPLHLAATLPTPPETEGLLGRASKKRWLTRWLRSPLLSPAQPGPLTLVPGPQQLPHEPLMQLRRDLRRLRTLKNQLMLSLLFCLLCCVVMGQVYAAFAALGLFALATILCDPPKHWRFRHPQRLWGPGGLCLAVSLFVRLALPEALPVVGLIFCLIVSTVSAADFPLADRLAYCHRRALIVSAVGLLLGIIGLVWMGGPALGMLLGLLAGALAGLGMVWASR